MKAKLVEMEEAEAAKNGKVATEEFAKLLTGDWGAHGRTWLEVSHFR